MVCEVQMVKTVMSWIVGLVFGFGVWVVFP